MAVDWNYLSSVQIEIKLHVKRRERQRANGNVHRHGLFLWPFVCSTHQMHDFTSWNGYDIQRYFWKVLALFYNHRLVIVYTWELLKISSSITNLYYEERKLQKCWYTSKAYSNECHILVFVLLHVRDWPKKSVIFRMKHRYNVFPQLRLFWGSNASSNLSLSSIFRPLPDNKVCQGSQNKRLF